MNDLTTSTITDSSPASYPGTKASANNPQVVAGKIGNAQDFSSDYIAIGTPDINAVNWEIQSWVKGDAFAASTWHMYFSYGGNNYTGVYNTRAETRFEGVNGGNTWGTPSTATYYHLVVGFGGGTNSYYRVNGTQSFGTVSGTASVWGTEVAKLGAYTNDALNWDGIVDEFRILNASRSVDYTITEYTNQSAPATFSTPAIASDDFTRSITDGMGISDTLSRLSSYVRARTDNMGLTDVLSRVTESYRIMTQNTVGITDTIVKASTVFVGIDQDTIGLTDILLPIKVQAIRVEDIIGVTDTLSRLAQFSKKITDTVGLTDTLFKLISYSRDVTDTVGLTDSIDYAQLTNYIRSLTDSVGLTDSATFVTTTADVYDPIIEFYQVESIIPTLEIRGN